MNIKKVKVNQKKKNQIKILPMMRMKIIMMNKRKRMKIIKIKIIKKGMKMIKMRKI